MAPTAAKKQRRYRKRHLGINGTKDRIQLFISIQAKARTARDKQATTAGAAAGAPAPLEAVRAALRG